MKKAIGILVLVASYTLFAAPPTGKYETAVEQMRVLQSQFPSYSSLFSIGENDEGTEIIAMRVSLTPNMMDPDKIGQLIVATHHGNEGHSTTYALRFLERLLEKYSGPELFEGRLTETEWTIIPVLNISGYNANRRQEYGIDPNRDYPGPCISNPGGRLKSSRTVMKFLTTRIFTGTITVHGYIGTLTYPWGISLNNTHTLDHNQYVKITSKAAEYNGYRYGTSTDIVYPANGTYEDYVYWKYGIWSLLVELRTGSSSDIEDTVDATEVFFDELDSSPSTSNQMTGQCVRPWKPDLHIE